jgi:hypothetical protein
MIDIPRELPKYNGEFKDVEFMLEIKNSQNSKIGFLRTTLNGIQKVTGYAPPLPIPTRSRTVPNGTDQTIPIPAPRQSLNVSSLSPSFTPVGSTPTGQSRTTGQQRSDQVIRMSVDEMSDREVNFLLKRRGTSIIPSDMTQARAMAKEQRAKDREEIQKLTVRQMKEELDKAAVDYSTVIEREDLIKMMMKAKERDLFNRSRPPQRPPQPTGSRHNSETNSTGAGSLTQSNSPLTVTDLPEGWEMRHDSSGRPYFVDHVSQDYSLGKATSSTSWSRKTIR